MRKTTNLICLTAAACLIAGNGWAQSLIDSYTAEIGAADRVNSSGQPLSRPAQILAQDRANVHRFGTRQAADTVDRVFSDRGARAAFPQLLSRGAISGSARQALRSGAPVTLQVSVFGHGGTPSHVTVDVAGSPDPSVADAPLNQAEITQDARRIQSALNARGFDAGPEDGQPGSRTRRAIEEFQTSIAAPVTGELTRDQLAVLMGAADLAQDDTAAAAAGGTADAAEVGSRDGLVLVDGHPVWGDFSNYVRLPEGAGDLGAHAQEMAHRLVRAAWLAKTDDLEAALGQAPSGSHLQSFYKLLREPSQAEVTQLGLSLGTIAQNSREYCQRRPLRDQFSCATQHHETEFDRRRFREGMAGIIARDAAASALELPLDVTVFCTLGQIDQAYDFNNGMVEWGKMMGSGSCRGANTPFGYMSDDPLVEELDLASGMPEATAMPADQVEALARQHVYDPSGLGLETRLAPLMLVFQGQISIARTGEAGNSPLGLAPVQFTLSRTGPINLRWSHEPLKNIITFEGASPESMPTEALDLWNAHVAHDLAGDAPELDPAALEQAVARLGEPDGSGRMVRIPARIRKDDQGRHFLHSSDFAMPEDPSRQVAQMAGLPAEQVVWTQLPSKDRGVPDTELVLIFPQPFSQIRSTALDPETAAIKHGARYLMAKLSHPMTMSGMAGEALVAVVRPTGFEVHEPGIGNAMRLAARPLLAETEIEPMERIFVPSAYWYALKAAELTGTDIEAHMNAVFDRANLMSGDTFARIDAVKEAVAAAERAAAGQEDEQPWIVGRISLGAYDMQRGGWPVNSLGIELPVSGDVESAIARRVLPDIERTGLILPMSEADARGLNDKFRGSSRQLPFRARIDIAPPRAASGLSPQAFLREVSLLPPAGSRSQRIPVSASFRPGEELATILLPAPDRPAPAAPVPDQVTAARTSADTQPAAPSSGADATGEDWPAMPDVAVMPSAWDMLGLRTGMTVADAEAAVLERGGVVSAFQRPRGDLHDATVRSVQFQRLYILGDGTEAITIAGPAPDGPVLAVMRRMLLPRGDLPFADIRTSLLEKYGPPQFEGQPEAAMAPMVWYSGEPGARQPACRAQLSTPVRINQWQRLEGIGDPAFDISQRPAAWDEAVQDFPVDYAEQATPCGQMMHYAAKSAADHGAASFAMQLLDMPAILAFDEAIAGVPDAAEVKIDF